MKCADCFRKIKNVRYLCVDVSDILWICLCVHAHVLRVRLCLRWMIKGLDVCCANGMNENIADCMQVKRQHV